MKIKYTSNKEIFNPNISQLNYNYVTQYILLLCNKESTVLLPAPLRSQPGGRGARSPGGGTVLGGGGLAKAKEQGVKIG